MGVYQNIAPSIVRVNTRFASNNGGTERGRGTGIVLDQRGTILTSLHVVRGSLETKVVFADGTESLASIAAQQPEKDIAVLRSFSPPAGLLPATLGNPRFLQVGDEAIEGMPPERLARGDRVPGLFEEVAAHGEQPVVAGQHPPLQLVEHDCAVYVDLDRIPEEVPEVFAMLQAADTVGVFQVESRAQMQTLPKSRPRNLDDLVVEVASNDGYLLQNFKERGVPILGIEPAQNVARVAREKGIPTVAEFFTAGLAEQLAKQGSRADAVVGNNVLAHVAELNDFVRGIEVLLKPEGVAVLEVPYVRDMVERCEFDTIYHEHVSYFSVTAAKRLFERHGLSLNHLRHFPIHGGTFRFTLGRKEEVSPAVRALLVEDEAAGLTTFGYFRHFGERVAEVLVQAVGRPEEAAHGAAAQHDVAQAEARQRESEAKAGE